MTHDDRVVSVIVPMYDRRRCVMDAVGSVLVQTHGRVECIVVDDGSTDGSFDLVANTFAGDDRVRVFAQAHRGVSAARNRGISEAHGEYVTFLDSDDLMPPTRVARQLALLAEHGCDGVFGTGESSVMPGVAPPAWFERRPDWRRGHCWISLLTATECLRAVNGFDETLRTGEDTDLILKLRHAGFSVRPVDEVFVHRRLFGDNLTKDLGERDWVMRDMIRRHVARRRDSSLGR